MAMTNPYPAFYETIAVHEGAMAYVHISTKKGDAGPADLPAKVAIKQLKPNFADQPKIAELFYREGLILLLSGYHSNIIRTYSAHQYDMQLPFIVLEAGDCNLREYLFHHRLTLKQCLEIGFDICQAFIHMVKTHDSFTHGDLKPENLIMVNGKVKVSDFGVSHLKFQHAPVEIDYAGLGTIAYFAPERFKNQISTTQADIFAFGRVMSEILVGVAPDERIIRLVKNAWHRNYHSGSKPLQRSRQK